MTERKFIRRHHAMPFGAELLATGQTRFSLWAPSAHRVDLCLLEDERELSLPMRRTGEGWFETFRAGTGADSLYRFRIDGGICVPDPASRGQADSVHGYSRVADAESWPWTDLDWAGRPWEEAVVYELHVGSFTPEGDFNAAAAKLDYLLDLGVTALQLMPVAAFPGRRDWGYDGVLPFAPAACYGTPDELKRLVQTAHAKGLMVLLDVVYNHFGPEGNYLHLYAPAFFSDKHHTPWGPAINFDGEASYWVRRFFIENALYWLEEFHFDGLRLDAVHAIFVDSEPDILEELANAVRQKIGVGRRVHLILENDRNAAHYLAGDYAAQWNDDAHHILHVLLSQESHGYYADYAGQPIAHLARCLTEGFAYQGESSIYRHGEKRGEPSRQLPPLAFVTFLQNHDQIGNRALGERISALAPAQAIRAATALLLLAPFPPLLFMGQEWGCRKPFLFFCDFEAGLSEKVAEGRRREFLGFPGFEDEKSLAKIPDPASEQTFRQSTLDWEALESDAGRQWLDFHRRLLALRRQEIVPRLNGIEGGDAVHRLLDQSALQVSWKLGDGSRLHLIANLGPAPARVANERPGRLLFATPPSAPSEPHLPAWSVIWTLVEGEDGQ